MKGLGTRAAILAAILYQLSAGAALAQRVQEPTICLADARNYCAEFYARDGYSSEGACYSEQYHACAEGAEGQEPNFIPLPAGGYVTCNGHPC